MHKHKPSRSQLLAVLLAAAACGCGPERVIVARSAHSAQGTEYAQSCRRYAVRVSGPYHQDLAGPVEHPLLDAMPKEARRTARAGGLEPLILRLLQEVSTQGLAPSLVHQALRQELFMRLVSLETQLESILSEIDCTDDVVEELQALLDARERKRELKWTLASIVVGAASAAVAGAWEITNDDSHGGPIVGVIGGVSSAWLGLMALMPKDQRLEYSHTHNLLRPIAHGEDPTRIYPTFVRRLLYAPGAAGEPAPAEALREEFEHKISTSFESEAERSYAREVLYGTGGVYDQRLVGVREFMFDALEAKLNVFARELELLTRYLVNLTATPDAAEQNPERAD